MATHIVQQGESYSIPCPALLLQLGKLTQNLRTFTGGGVDVSSWHHYPGKNTQTPADCKPACDAPHAAICSLGDDSQWVLLKDRGQSCCPSSHSNSRSKNLQAKNKKITQQAKHSETGERSGATCRWFPWGVQLRVLPIPCRAGGTRPLQSESELLLELLELLECWRR